MPQIYQGSSKSGQSVSTSILTEKDLTLAHSGHFEEEGLNMVVCPKPELNLGFFGDLEENAFIRLTWVLKGGPKEERTYKCAKKLWKSGGYLFQLEQVTKQHVILNALNNFLRHADGRLSAVWSQLSTNADNVSFSTARYYKRKGAQVLETVFEAIAPGQSKWGTQQVIEKYCHSTNSEVNTPEQTLLSGLIILYNETSSWYTRQQILSVFVCDYCKTELLNYLPG